MSWALRLSGCSLGVYEAGLATATNSSTKESRAEQNRRAQQAFRRRREERMRDLESAAAALEPISHRMVEAEDKLFDAALVSHAVCPSAFRLQA